MNNHNEADEIQEDPAYTLYMENNKEIKLLISKMLSPVVNELMTEEYDFNKKKNNDLKDVIKIAFSMYFEYYRVAVEALNQKQAIVATTNILYINNIAIDMKYIYGSDKQKSRAKKYVDNVREYFNRVEKAYKHANKDGSVDYDLSVSSWIDIPVIDRIHPDDTTFRLLNAHLSSGYYPNPAVIGYKYDEDKIRFAERALYWSTFIMLAYASGYGEVTGIDLDDLDRLGQLLVD